MLMTHLQKLLKATSIAILAATATGADEMPELGDIVQVSLISGWQTEAGAYIGAFRVTMAPGWKTYWRVPGDAGQPPVFSWANSTNLGTVDYLWPRPDVFQIDGVTVIGYRNELVLPIRFTPRDPAQAVSATAIVDLGVCKDVCVPIRTEISTALDQNSDADRFLIELALADRPENASDAGVKQVSCTLSQIEDGYQVNAEINMPTAAQEAELVVFETPQENIWIAPATSHRDGALLRAQTSLVSFDGGMFEFEPSDLRITLISANSAIDIQSCPSG